MHHLFSYLLINPTHLLAIEKPLAKRSIFPVSEHLWLLHGCLTQLQCLLHSPHFIWTCRHTISHHLHKNSEHSIIKIFLQVHIHIWSTVCCCICSSYYLLLLLLISYCDRSKQGLTQSDVLNSSQHIPHGYSEDCCCFWGIYVHTKCLRSLISGQSVVHIKRSISKTDFIKSEIY